MANTLWALTKLGYSPSQRLMSMFFVATDQRLSGFRPAELSIIAWACAKNKYQPGKLWMEEFLKVRGRRGRGGPHAVDVEEFLMEQGGGGEAVLVRWMEEFPKVRWDGGGGRGGRGMQNGDVCALVGHAGW